MTAVRAERSCPLISTLALCLLLAGSAPWPSLAAEPPDPAGQQTSPEGSGPPPSGPAAQEEAGTPAAPPEPTWDLGLGLSFLATTGNSETSSAGADGIYHRDWEVWAFESGFAAVRASEGDETTAETYSAFGRGKRAIGERLSATTGLKGERDRFAGIDLRTVLDLGISWKLAETEAWELDSVTSLTWSHEEPTGTLPTRDFLGALLRLAALARLTATSEATGEVTLYPSLEESDDYRAEGKLALQASLNRRLALRFGYEVKYDNVPVPGFETTDTATTASLVLRLGRETETE